MTRYRVRFEYRSPGAIGSFQIHDGLFAAEEASKAKDMVFDQLQAQGFETRGCAVYEGERLVMGGMLEGPAPARYDAMGRLR